ncbi:Transcription elongation factor 1 like protein [Chelonia mydas]|uniref:Transcription elongation factor 1 homolog n=1 Tax=Chelonia mydas TaxID=8469 RepID=M7BH75_CHEMY|nr:Transcription elongation factor 1 like protein [Chelonia mydas]
MGRRKSKRKPPPKKKMTGTLETQFTCPFCNHEKSCDVKIVGIESEPRRTGRTSIGDLLQAPAPKRDIAYAHMAPEYRRSRHRQK